MTVEFVWPHQLTAAEPTAKSTSAKVRAVFEAQPAASLTVRAVMQATGLTADQQPAVEEALRRLAISGWLTKAKTGSDPRTSHRRWAYSRDQGKQK